MLDGRSEISLRGKRVLVMGLGRFGGGVGVSRWLVEQGAVVTVNDAAGGEELAESVGKLAGLPITFKLGGHEVADFLAADLLVVNPAVDKEKSGVVRAAIEAGVAYTTEMNLFVERCRGLTIGVTGSVGKSTTTTLIYEAIRAGLGGGEREDCRVFMGGNIGRSLLPELGRIREGDIVVLELSSFMLEDTYLANGGKGWSPGVAVVTNVFPNHLDRHGGTMEGYAGAKRNILRFQREGGRDVAILNGDHEEVAGWARFAKGRVVKYSTKGVGRMEMVLPGEHNQSNARAALAVLEALPEGVRGKIDRERAVRGMGEFAGLSHRLQRVHTLGMKGRGDLQFFNDSKATSPDASMTALLAFEKGTAVFLVGGYDKHVDLSGFEGLLAERAGGVIGIGQTGEAIVENVRRAASGALEGHVAYAGTVEAGVELAMRWGESCPELEAVVLSPASASWGQFKNYEERGDTFVRAARWLPAS